MKPILPGNTSVHPLNVAIIRVVPGPTSTKRSKMVKPGDMPHLSSWLATRHQGCPRVPGFCPFNELQCQKSKENTLITRPTENKPSCHNPSDGTHVPPTPLPSPQEAKPLWKYLEVFGGL